MRKRNVSFMLNTVCINILKFFDVFCYYRIKLTLQKGGKIQSRLQLLKIGTEFYWLLKRSHFSTFWK